MSNIIIVGIQWGDEGKGKIIDLLAAQSEAAVRFQGGNNAGHTIYFNNDKVVLHLIPSGIFHDKCTCIIANGVVLDPEVLCREIELLKHRGLLKNNQNLKISDRAHLILPYHKKLDNLREMKLGHRQIGTTRRGIGPAYEDKVGRRGFMVGDLFYGKGLKERLRAAVEQYNEIFQKMFQSDGLDFSILHDQLMNHADGLKPYVCNTTRLLSEMIQQDKNILFEGAQGTLLDIDHGTYPYVTSSNTVAGAVFAGAGIGPKCANQVIGVSKAYCTRVGSGPFPTELTDETGTYLQNKGREFGSTTGRKRRCGWLDLVALKHAALVNGMTGLILTKLDVLSGLKTIKTAVQYKYNRVETDVLPFSAGELENCTPVYQEMPGWQEDLSHVQSFGNLHKACQNFVRFIEDALSVPVVMVSVGPKRGQEILLRDVWQYPNCSTDYLQRF